MSELTPPRRWPFVVAVLAGAGVLAALVATRPAPAQSPAGPPAAASSVCPPSGERREVKDAASAPVTVTLPIQSRSLPVLAMRTVRASLAALTATSPKLRRAGVTAAWGAMPAASRFTR